MLVTHLLPFKPLWLLGVTGGNKVTSGLRDPRKKKTIHCSQHPCIHLSGALDPPVTLLPLVTSLWDKAFTGNKGVTGACYLLGKARAKAA